VSVTDCFFSHVRKLTQSHSPPGANRGCLLFCWSKRRVKSKSELLLWVRILGHPAVLVLAQHGSALLTGSPGALPG
jgi:hypothetical protein